jgi:hypothetical protein
MTQAFDDYAASRPGPFVPRRRWGELWHSFNYAWHYDRTGRYNLRDYWLAQADDIASFRATQRLPVDTAGKT